MVNNQFLDNDQLATGTKQAQRGKRRAKEKAKMPQHGKSLAKVYKDAVSKRAKDTKADGQLKRD